MKRDLPMHAIEARNLTKHYRLYAKPIDRLKEALTRRPFHKVVESLQDVSFDLPVGRTLGVIGQNGAGKSTLLKILARIVHPTSGNLVLRGRVAALIELGAGFHQEFSGRENIQLNAALLGLSEEEIRAREGDIIAFSELGDVIDRPVKTYSSGMYVRLAFSIATSVDPDVLIIDEALSVGDQQFQQKCVERMMGFRTAGKTIIVCSHSMFMINELCAESLWLKSGRLQCRGDSPDVISEYVAFIENNPATRNAEPDAAPDEEKKTLLPEVMLTHVDVADEAGRPVQSASHLQTIRVRMKTRCTGEACSGHVGVGLQREDGLMIFAATSHKDGNPPIRFGGRQTLELKIPSLPLLNGRYRAKAVVSDTNGLRAIHERMSDPFLIRSKHPELGLVQIEHEWLLPKE